LNPPEKFRLWVLISICFFAGTACDRKQEPRIFMAPKVDTEFVVAPPQVNRNPMGTQPPMMAGGSIPMAEKRILGAIFPLHGMGYFLKITDRIDRIEKVAGLFDSVVATFDVDPQTKRPVSSFPEGWTVGPGDDFADAKIAIPMEGEKPLMMTVTSLPAPPLSDWDSYLLAQVNRWRGQVGLSELSLDGLKESLTPIARKDSEVPAYIFDKKGAVTSSGSPNPSTSVTNNLKDSPATPEKTRKLIYDLPSKWSELPARPFQMAAFRIPGENGESDGEIVVSEAIDSPVENCKMWAQQILKLDDPAILEKSAAKMIEQAEAISAMQREAKLYSIRSSDASDASCLTIVTIPSEKPPQAVFVKMKSGLRMSEEQKSNLLSFVKTMRWE
jgi:hypothetical protein